MSTGPRILFLLPVASQARYRKRIKALTRCGVTSVVMAFEREYYASELEGGYISLGKIDHGAYASRLPRSTRALKRICAKTPSVDVIYAFGMDMLLLGWLASRGSRRRIKLVYEVGDIRPIQLDGGVIPTVLRQLERFLVGRCHSVVVTSQFFLREYYQGNLCLDHTKFQVIENKLDPEFAPQPTLPFNPSNDQIRIGYFGLLRCPRSWEILKDLAKTAQGRVRIYVRGFPTNPKDIAAEARRVPHIEFGGPYHAPDELPDLYGQVDLVWACYPYHRGSASGNWRWARTNRFYEACYFSRPMICQAGSADCETVTAFRLGLNLDLDDVPAAVNSLLAVTPQDIRTWNHNFEAVPGSVYLYGDEHERLLEALNS